jgi:hypothetical protein
MEKRSMTADDDDCAWLDKPLTVDDYIEIVSDDLEEAVDRLDASDVRKLIAAVRKKLDLLEREAEPEPEERRDRWWDR